jgi:hypothetical protein
MLSYYLVAGRMQDQHLRFSTVLEKSRDECGLFFLDSGAHSLYTKYVIDRGHRDGYAFYDTDEFWSYVDSYAGFVKKYIGGIDYYANVDVIFNPEKSWEVLKYLENTHKLSPVPVIHYGTSLDWIHKHLGAGYRYIGLGGLGQEATAKAYRKWADAVFDILCPLPNRTPIVRTHGFAMTAYDLMIRYPWWSVDSATWTKVAAFGSIFVPHRRSGKYIFDEQPYMVSISQDNPARKDYGKHYCSLTPIKKKLVHDWLEQIEVPFGETAPDGTVIEYGVTNRHSERKIANLKFFEELRKWLGPYPRRYEGPTTSSKGLVF